MKPEDILLALGEIDETLPAECVQQVKKKPNPWKSVVAAAACIAAVLVSVVFSSNLIKSSAPVTSESEEVCSVNTERFSDTPDAHSLPEESSVTAAALSQTQAQTKIPMQSTTQAPAAETTVPASGKAAACDHRWIDADCNNPRTCSICGATTGAPNKHNYAAATCDKPQTCRDCGATTGSPLGHDYAANGYCKRCHKSRFGDKDPNYVPNTKPTTSTTTSTTTTTTGVTISQNPEKAVTLPPHVQIAASPIGGEDSTLHTTAVQTDWNNKPVRDKYPVMRYNGEAYSYYGASDQQDAGQSLGTCTLQGSDGEPEHAVTVEVYALSDVSPETEVLVRFPDGSCYRYK